MHRKKAIALAAGLATISFVAQAVSPAAPQAKGLSRAAEPFSGTSALAFTKQLVAFGPRPSGSPALKKTQSYILAQLKSRGCEIIQDPFTAQTPLGPKSMLNIVARFPGSSGRAVVISGHYETKVLPGIHFVGANDAGASAGFLLEMARVLAGRKLKNDVYLVWFDGEESFGVWSERDGIYGSRHLAERWSADGTLGRIKALINVDMIGDKDLGILREMHSSAGLQRLVWQAAAELNLGRYFLNLGGAVEDDHVPFLRRGVQAVNLIDFDYGPDNSYWHTEKDTLDKLSAESFQVVGTVLLEVLRRLE